MALQLAVDRPTLVSHLVRIGAGAQLRMLPAFLEEARTLPERALRNFIEGGLKPTHEAEAHHHLDRLQPIAPGVMQRNLRCALTLTYSGRRPH